jgi:hypothetical protein
VPLGPLQGWEGGWQGQIGSMRGEVWGGRRGWVAGSRWSWRSYWGRSGMGRSGRGRSGWRKKGKESCGGKSADGLEWALGWRTWVVVGLAGGGLR